MRTDAKAIRLFTCSSGALLLALASAAVIVNLAGPKDLVPVRDLVTGAPFNYTLWVAGGLALAIGLLALVTNRPAWAGIGLAWLATNFLVYRAGLASMGCGSLTGFLGSITYEFGISARSAAFLLDVMFGYLLAGSLALLVRLEWRRRCPPEKMVCPICGTHIEFSVRNLGQKVPCPQCTTAITLRRPEPLKTACFFCKGHIEFPPYAVGEKIHCPHCKMDITLKEPVNTSGPT